MIVFRVQALPFRSSHYRLKKNQEYDHLLHAIRIPFRCNRAIRILHAIPLYVGKNHEYDRLQSSYPSLQGSDPPLSSFPLEVRKKSRIWSPSSCNPTVCRKKKTNMIVLTVQTLPFGVQTLPFQASHNRSEKNQEYDHLLHTIRIPFRCNHEIGILHAIPLCVG